MFVVSQIQLRLADVWPARINLWSSRQERQTQILTMSLPQPARTQEKRSSTRTSSSPATNNKKKQHTRHGLSSDHLSKKPWLVASNNLLGTHDLNARLRIGNSSVNVYFRHKFKLNLLFIRHEFAVDSLIVRHEFTKTRLWLGMSLQKLSFH